MYLIISNQTAIDSIKYENVLFKHLIISIKQQSYSPNVRKKIVLIVFTD